MMATIPDDTVVDNLGVSLELEPQVAEELRHRDEERRQKQEQRQREEEQEEEEEDDASNVYEHHQVDEKEEIVIDGENWDDVLLLPPHLQVRSNYSSEGSGLGRESAVIHDSDHEDDDDDDHKNNNNDKEDDDDDAQNADKDSVSVLSASPPNSLPTLLIDLVRLLGFRPSTILEVKALQVEIQNAMWGDLTTTTTTTTEKLDNNVDLSKSASQPTTDKDIPVEEIPVVSLEFESRVSQLLETGAARHSDTLQQQQQQSSMDSNYKSDQNYLAWMSIPYPTYFQTVSGGNIRVAKTERLWKRLLQPHPVAIVDRLLQHLRNCSRCLSWKVDLRQEINHLAKQEEKQRLQQLQKLELEEWQQGRRQAALQKLYNVRETLLHRVEMARLKLQALEQARDDLVVTKLRQRRLQHLSTDKNGGRGDLMVEEGGLEAFDFASTALFAFPEGFLGGSPESDFNEENDFNLMDDGSDHESYESPPHELSAAENENDGLADSKQWDGHTESETNTEADDIPAASRPDQSAPERYRQKQQQKRQQEERLQEAAREAEHKLKLERAQKQQDEMVEACTTQEFKITQALLMSLEDRLAQTDDLIETMQDEEWADQEQEEEGEEEDEPKGTDNGDKKRITTQSKHELEGDNTTEPEFTLLDQILAMILGAIPSPLANNGKNASMEQHLHWVHSEHRSIVQEWKRHFGRLPPPLALGNSNGGSGKKEDATTATAKADQEPVSFSPTERPKTPKAALCSLSLEEDDEEEGIAVKRDALRISQMETRNWDDDTHDGNCESEDFVSSIPPVSSTSTSKVRL